MRKVFSIAYGTFIEAFRSGLFLSLFLAGVFLLLVSVFLPAVHPDDRLKLLLNVQITSLTLFSSMAMVFFMAPALPREIEERTIYPVLAKPVGRSVYLQGRLLGALAFGLAGICLASFLGLLYFVIGFPVLMDKGSSAHPMQYLASDEKGPHFDGEGLFILSHFPKDKLWLNERGNHTATWTFDQLDRLPQAPESLDLVLEMDRININTLAKAAKVHVAVIGGDSKVLFSKETYLEEKGPTLVPVDRDFLSGRQRIEIALRPRETSYFISVEPESVRLGYRGGSSLWANYFRAAMGAFFALALMTVVSLAASTYFSQKMAIAIGLFTYVAGNTLPYLRSFARLLKGGLDEEALTIPGMEGAQATLGALSKEDLPWMEWLTWLKSPLEAFCDLFPDFQKFDLTQPLVEGIYIENHLLSQAGFYLLAYSFPLFLISVAIFHRRELK